MKTNKKATPMARFTAEFKEQALILAKKQGCAKSARDLGVSNATLYYWRNQKPRSPKEIADYEELYELLIL